MNYYCENTLINRILVTPKIKSKLSLDISFSNIKKIALSIL